MRNANRLKLKAPMSESMWPASDSSARLLVRKPAISSAKKYTALMDNAHFSLWVSVCRSIEAMLWKSMAQGRAGIKHAWLNLKIQASTANRRAGFNPKFAGLKKTSFLGDSYSLPCWQPFRRRQNRYQLFAGRESHLRYPDEARSAAPVSNRLIPRRYQSWVFQC